MFSTTVCSKIYNFKVHDVNLNAENYCEFMEKTFLSSTGHNQEALS